MIIKTINGDSYTIKEGDRFRLDYYGDSNVPIWLENAWATVLKVKRTGSLVYQADIEAESPRTAMKRHVKSVVIEGIEQKISKG